VAAAEAAMLARWPNQLDERRRCPQGRAQVRALMFVRRFRDDIDRRLERCRTNLPHL
jgi:molecular chaperone HscB